MSTLAVQSSTAEAIHRTLEWLDQHSGDPHLPDARQFHRTPYRVTATISFLPPGTDTCRSFVVSTRNLSHNGLSFIHRALIYPPQKIQVSLPLPDHTVRQLKATVVRVRPATAGFYEIGVEFSDLQSPSC